MKGIRESRKSRHIIISLIFVISAACSTKNIAQGDVIKEQDAGAEDFALICNYPEPCFDIALRDYKDGRTIEAINGFLKVAEEFPDSRWKSRSLFMIGKIHKEAVNPLAADYLISAAKEYEELRDYALYFLAEHYFSRGYYSYAVENYDAVIKSFPYSPLISRAMYRKAETNLAAGYLFLARENFKEFIASFPDDNLKADAIYKIAEAFEKEGNDLYAADYYKRILYEYPYHSLAKGAAEKFAELKERSPKISDFSNEELIKKANNLYKYPLFGEAEKEYSRLLVILPEEMHGEILQRLGVSLFRLGKTDDALQVFNKIVNQRFSENSAAEALLWVGRCYARLGDYDNMLSSYLTILEKYSKSEWADEALFAIADYYSNKDDYKKAISYYKKLVNGFSESAFSENSHWYIGWLNYRLGNYKEASVRFDKFLAKYPLSEYANRVLYWKARSLENLGKANSAAAIYQKVCKTQFGFYCYNVRSRNISLIDAGFVNDYNIKEKEAIVDNYSNSVEDDPNFKRGVELTILGMNQDAINELYKLMQRMSLNKESLLIVSKKFYELGEYHRTVKSVIQNFYDKIENGGSDLPEYFWGLAYPQSYWSIANEYASRYNLDPYLVISIMREESWFDRLAVSRSGARGVMQLMPFTARWVSKQLRYDYIDDRNLFDVDTNINFGAWYLSYLKKRFNGNIILMIAGYNAGPEAVKKWVNGNDNIDIDEFIESIPYKETKGYVKRVLRSYAEYYRIYNNSRVQWGGVLLSANGGLN